MPNDRQELEELRRLDELERKAQGLPPKVTAADLVKNQPEEYGPEPEKYSPTATSTQKIRLRDGRLVDMPNEDTFLEGIGRGMSRAGRGAVNLGYDILNKVAPNEENLTKMIEGKPDEGRFAKPEFASNETIKEVDRRDQPLLKTTGGFIGDIAGNVAATAPLGTLSEGAQIARQGPGAARFLTRTLGGRAGKAALEGAANAEITGDPEDRGVNAALGGGLGVGVSKLNGAAGRIISGLAKKSDAAKDLELLASQHGRDIFIPITQAADSEGDIVTRGTKEFYKSALPLIPGVEGQLQSHSDKATQVLRELAAMEGDISGNVQPGANDMLQVRRALKGAFDKEYENTIKAYDFQIPADFKARVEARIRQAMPDVDESTLQKVSGDIEEKMSRYASGKDKISGTNLLNAKNSSNGLYGGYTENAERKALEHGSGVFDDLIEEHLTRGGVYQHLEDLARYRDLAEPYSNFKQFSRAVDAAQAEKGRFTPKQLADASKDPGTMLHMGTTGHEVLGQPAVKPSSAGRLLAYTGGLYSALATGGGTVPAIALGIGGGNLLATRTIQKFMMGDQAWQQGLKDLYAANPAMGKKVGQLIRASLTTQAGK